MKPMLAVSSIADLEASATSQPAVVIVDPELPGSSVGAEVIRHLSSRGLTVLVISAREGEADVLEAFGAGARGYLSKHSAPEEIIGAVAAAAAGRTYVSATVAGHLLGSPVALTQREREILRLVAGGETDQDIAQQLFISVNTVRSHLDRIRDKTGSRRRADLTRFALERGITRAREDT